MATKPKPGGPPAGEEESAEAKEAAPPKKSLVGSILGMLNPLAILRLPMLQKLIVLGGLLVVLGGADAVVFARYDDLDTQHVVPSGLSANPAGDRTELTFGLGFWPVPNVVLKADYQLLDAPAGQFGDDRINLGVGYMF